MFNLLKNMPEKNYLRKFVFLTMVFGLMTVLTGVVSVQNKGSGRVLTVNDDNTPIWKFIPPMKNISLFLKPTANALPDFAPVKPKKSAMSKAVRS